MSDPLMAAAEWVRAAFDSTWLLWCLAAVGAAVPVAIAGAWLIDHLPTRATTTKGNHHA